MKPANLALRGFAPLEPVRPDFVHRPGEGLQLREGWSYTRPNPFALLLLTPPSRPLP
jgi:hypothetical protein